MGTYYITKKEIDDINKIINASKGLDMLYNKLYELEINNKKETEEYKKYMEYLNISLEIEEKCYKDAALTPRKCSAFAKYLYEYKLDLKFLEDEQSIINQNYENRHIRRILVRFKNEIFKSNEELYNLLPPETASFAQAFNDEIDSKYLKNIMAMLNELDNDLYESYLFFLEEFKDNGEYPRFKNNFINSKYNISFIFKEMENRLINNNFDVKKDLYITSKIMANMFNIDIKFYKTLKDNYNEVKVNDKIKQLLNISDIDYNDNKKTSTALILTCYIKSCLLLMGDDSINDINFDFHDYIKNESYKQNHENNKISENLIIKCFKDSYKDKSKAKILSLKIN